MLLLRTDALPQGKIALMNCSTAIRRWRSKQSGACACGRGTTRTQYRYASIAKALRKPYRAMLMTIIGLAFGDMDIVIRRYHRSIRSS
jgi:hypothetical protein